MVRPLQGTGIEGLPDTGKTGCHGESRQDSDHQGKPGHRQPDRRNHRLIDEGAIHPRRHAGALCPHRHLPGNLRIFAWKKGSVVQRKEFDPGKRSDSRHIFPRRPYQQDPLLLHLPHLRKEFRCLLASSHGVRSGIHSRHHHLRLRSVPNGIGAQPRVQGSSESLLLYRGNSLGRAERSPGEDFWLPAGRPVRLIRGSTFHIPVPSRLHAYPPAFGDLRGHRREHAPRPRGRNPGDLVHHPWHTADPLSNQGQDQACPG
ncbi:hypothetical protein D3C80_718080 [compost metagenome]